LRSIKETRKLVDRILEAGIEIHITQKNRVIRNEEDLGALILNDLEAYGAAEYTRKLRERVTNAWADKKRNAGSEIVTSQIPFWLQVVDGKIVEIPEQAALVREIFRLAAMGLGAKKIAVKINGSMPLSSITRLLANRAVLGEYQPCRKVDGKRVPDGDVVLDYFPAIISPSEWMAARTEISRKDRVGNRRGFCTKNGNADNLFTGLLHDVTDAPQRSLVFQKKGRRHQATLISAYDPHRKSNRISYVKFETAFREFLLDLDWQSIANEGKSDEETELEKQLDVKLSELDRVERRIAKTKAAMDAEDVEPGALRVLAGKLDADETALSSLASEKDALQASLEAAKAKTAALEDVNALKEALSDLSNVELRLRARTEIRKRVSSVRFAFTQDWGVVAYVSFINGSDRVITIKGDRAMLLWIELNEHSGLRELVDKVKIIDL
jgi:hypothetical protein